MAFTLYPQDANADATCDETAGSNNPHDLSQTQGTTTTQTDNLAGILAYQIVRSYQMDVSGLSILTGSQSYSCSVSVNTAAKADARFRVRAIDRTGCSVSASSAYNTITGIAATVHTFSLTLNFNTATDEDLRFDFEAQENNGHGTRQIIWDVQDVNTWVIAPEVAGGAPRQVMIMKPMIPVEKYGKRLWLPERERVWLPLHHKPGAGIGVSLCV